MINFCLCIKAARYWWQQFDQYKVGVVSISESTMHTLLTRELNDDDFAYTIPLDWLDKLNCHIRSKELYYSKVLLPESFLQERYVTVSAAALKNMWQQRKNHKLEEWKKFFEVIRSITSEEYGKLENSLVAAILQ